VQGENQTGVANLTLDISVSGALRGSGSVRLLPRGVAIDKVALKPSQYELLALPPGADGLLHSTMEIKMGHERRTMPVAFLQPKENGVYHYRYDFDRDGAEEWVLENPQLRVIVSPESGGRAVGAVDKTSGESIATSVGLFRDNFSFTENPQSTSELRARGRYGLFNRAYAAAWGGDEKNPILKLRYEAAEVYPGGASIEKAIQFEGASGVRVDYHVELKTPDEGGAKQNQSQSFVAVNSLPALARPGRVTRFCWPLSLGSADIPGPTESGKTESDKAKDSRGSGWHCEDFHAAGNAIELPTGTKRVDVHTSGRPTTTIEWDCAAECGRMTIEPQHFSALFRLEFPRLIPGDQPGQYTVHIRASDKE
jgi:hypothetical protein